MPLRSINRHYHSQPDGDSIHFQANDPPRSPPCTCPHRSTPTGVLLRLDAIDAWRQLNGYD
jgi:hypothetical protein